MKLRIFLFVVLALGLQKNLKAQGCSDAGICTITSFKPNGIYAADSLTTSYKVGASIGSADHDISIFSTYIEYDRNVNNRLGVNAKLTSLAQSGNGISVWGLSDFYLTGKYRVWDQLNLVLGVKAPLTTGNRLKDQRPLPMDYQASLGTVDGVFGLGYRLANLQLMLGYQHPFIQNENTFDAARYAEDNILSTFQTTVNYKRKSDALVRISYDVPVMSRLRITPSVLAVYHLADDTYRVGPVQEVAIVGSQGLTVNGNVYLDYAFLTHHAVQFSVGAPFVVRDIRPDGLTRGLVLGFEYKYTY